MSTEQAAAELRDFLEQRQETVDDENDSYAVATAAYGPAAANWADNHLTLVPNDPVGRKRERKKEKKKEK